MNETTNDQFLNLIPPIISENVQSTNPISLINKSSKKMVNSHVLPSIKLDENSFIINHNPNQNQYLDLARVNSGTKEKTFILTELKESLVRTNDLTFVTILHDNRFSNDLTNINLLLSFQPKSTINSPNLNTTTTGGSNLTSLNSVLTNATAETNINSTTSIKNSPLELVSTNIEKRKELPKNFVKDNRLTNQSISDEIDVNRTLLTNEELLDNNSTSALYSSIGDDILNINVNDSLANKINSTSLDLIYDTLNETITKDDFNTTKSG